jgi:hypothetical protein
MRVTPALRSQLASLWDDLGGQTLYDTELALAAEREENAMLRAKIEAGEGELLKFKAWFLDASESYGMLCERHQEVMSEKLGICDKLRQERVAHAATKAKIAELEALNTALETQVKCMYS